jgi:hypothetical protein
MGKKEQEMMRRQFGTSKKKETYPPPKSFVFVDKLIREKVMKAPDNANEMMAF